MQRWRSGLQGWIAIVGIGIVSVMPAYRAFAETHASVQASATARTAPSDSNAAPASGDGNDIALEGEAATQCRQPRSSDGAGKCVELIEAGMASGKKFTGFVTSGAHCISYTQLRASIKSIAAEISTRLDRLGPRILNSDIDDSHLILQTLQMPGTRATYYVSVKGVPIDSTPQCRYNAVSSLTFAVIAKADKTTVVRSDSLARQLMEIVDKYLKDLEQG